LVAIPRGPSGLDIVNVANPATPYHVYTIPGDIIAADFQYPEIIVVNSATGNAAIYVAAGSVYTLQSTINAQSNIRDACFTVDGQAAVVEDDAASLWQYWYPGDGYYPNAYEMDRELGPYDATGRSIAFRQWGYSTAGALFVSFANIYTGVGFFNAWEMRLASFYSSQGAGIGGGDLRVQSDNSGHYYLTNAYSNPLVNQKMVGLYDVTDLPYDGAMVHLAEIECPQWAYGASYSPYTNRLFSASWSTGFEIYHLTCRTIEPIEGSIVRALSQTESGYLHSFRWETTGLSDPDLDQVDIYTISGASSCVPGQTQVVGGTIEQLPSGNYLHVVQTESDDCVIPCRNEFTVTSGFGDDVFESERHVMSQKLCPSNQKSGSGTWLGGGQTRITSVSPNPFNPATSIQFVVPADSRNVRLEIIDLEGKLVCRLYEGAGSSEPMVQNWRGLDGSGRRVHSGVYFVRLIADGAATSSKLVLLK